MKYQEPDLHLVLYSSLPSANNNVGSCWPTMLRPFGRGFSLLGLRYTSLALLNQLIVKCACIMSQSLISSFAHEMDFAHNFSVDSF